jgi:hypothetical protein
MTQAVKTALTLAVAALLLLLALAWGWSALTAPLPDLAKAPVCVETPVSKGDKVTPSQVTVSVLNAGKRSGLASRTMTAFVDQGFTKGDSANAPARTRVGNAEIWTDDPQSPAVALVRSRLGKVKVVRRSLTQVGVVVVVGDRFKKVGKGVAAVTSTTDTTICSPAT